MQISEFFKIFDLTATPQLEKVRYYVACHDFNSAKKELLQYFIARKKNHLSTAEAITEKDKNFSLAYISRHGILSGPNEADCYLSSMFVAPTDTYTSLDIFPFIKSEMSLMLMSRQKESGGALFYSPNSIFPPYVSLLDSDGNETVVHPFKHAYISPKSPDKPLCEEDIYEICETSLTPAEAFSDGTGRVYLSFRFPFEALSKAVSARLCAKVSLPKGVTTKELLLFNIADSSWDNSLTWDSVKGNVYSWESSPTGPEWVAPAGSDSEYLNVTCRFWFARPMAYQYLTDVEKNSIYGEKLLFLMDAFSKKKEGGFNRVLETGERLSNFTAVLNALVDTPAMTPDYLISILWIMYRDMKSLIENPDLGWSNWAVVRTSGLSKAIDFLPELKNHNEWKTQTRDVMSTLFDRMYSPDFSFREAGYAYSFWCMELFVSAFKTAQMNNDPYSAFMRNRLEKAFNASLDMLYPNLYDTNIGDSNYTDKSAYIKSCADLFPTKKLKAVVSGTDSEDVASSSFYPDAAIAVMRTSFDRDKGIYILFNENPFDGHAHNDLGNMVMYAAGRVLITDSGRYGYSGGNISSYLKTAAAHNSIEIENTAYCPHSKAQCKITHFASNNMFDFTSGSSTPYPEIEATHKRSIFFVKKYGFAIVSDTVSCKETAMKFNQNWHFMPHANPSVGYDNRISTRFPSGVNLLLLCPDADITSTDEALFSAGYGMCEKNYKGVFSIHGERASFTTLLLPHSETPTVSAESITPSDKAYNSAVFTFGKDKGVFFSKNTQGGEFLNYTFDGEAAFIIGNESFIAEGKTLTSNSVKLFESPKNIKDMYLHVSGGVVTIESSSLKRSTNKDEAVKIYAPKATHVIFNGESIPFTLYSDIVYAVAPN